MNLKFSLVGLQTLHTFKTRRLKSTLIQAKYTLRKAKKIRNLTQVKFLTNAQYQVANLKVAIATIVKDQTLLKKKPQTTMKTNRSRMN